MAERNAVLKLPTPLPPEIVKVLSQGDDTHLVLWEQTLPGSTCHGLAQLIVNLPIHVAMALTAREGSRVILYNDENGAEHSGDEVADQAKALFAGILRAALEAGVGTSSSHASSASAPEQCFHAAFPRGLWQALPRGRDSNPAPAGRAFVAIAPIQPLGIQAGDVVVFLLDNKLRKAERRAIRGTIRHLSRNDYPILAENFAAMQFMQTSWDRGGDAEDQFRDLASHLRNAYREAQKRSANGRPLPDASSRLVVVRPWNLVGKPIDAPCDDAAIASLIRSAGGRP